MTISRTKVAKLLREKKIFNNWELLTKFGTDKDVAVEYSVGVRTSFSSTSVWSPTARSRVFPGNSKYSLSKALEFAEKFSGDEFVLSPFGGLIPDRVYRKAVAGAQLMTK